MAVQTSRPTRARPQPATPRPKPKRPQISRRSFLRNAWLAGLGASLAGFGAGTVYFLWPNLTGGFGSRINAGSLSDIDAAIASDGYYYNPEGRFYVVPYEGDDPEGQYAGVADDGYMALYQTCPHLGCRVPWCQTSRWWECPCHGSQYNQAGEYKLGPAPRGMDRFEAVVEGNNLMVDTAVIIQGPPRGTDTTGQQLEGPHCISAGEGEAH